MKAAEAFETLHGLEAPPEAHGLLKLLYQSGRRAACDALMLAAAEARGNIAQWHKALGFLREAKEPRLPFSGEELLNRGLASGKAIGDALTLLEVHWIDAGFPEEPGKLTALLDAVIAAAK